MRSCFIQPNQVFFQLETSITVMEGLNKSTEHARDALR